MPENMLKPPTMRELMPAGFTRILIQRTGITDTAAISKLVNNEQTTSKHWPAVEQLAQETNPKGFAQWQAAKATPVAA